MKTWYMIFASACAVAMPAFADGEGEEPAAIRVTSEAVTFKLRTGSGRIAVPSADLTAWPVTYRAGETVTLTSPGGASTTPVSDAAANGETALADAYYAASVIYPEQFRDIDPVAKAQEIFEELLGVDPYADLKEAGYEFRPVEIGKK